MTTTRDSSIDILRGLAIFTMIAANLAAHALAQPHPLWLRFYGSFAVPLFIFISGLMIASTAQKKSHELKYYIIRGAMVILAGVFVDIFIWRIYPFMSVDVLYLIGVSLPLAYIAFRMNTIFQWLITLLIFLGASLLQKTAGYTNYPTEIHFLGTHAHGITADITKITKHWIIDGWFPILPWLGFSLLGVISANLRTKLKNSLGNLRVFLVGLTILAIGIILWNFLPGMHMLRKGYSELFYPPDLSYCITAIGIIITSFSIIDFKPSPVIYKPLQILGESALSMYILHLLLIQYAINVFWPNQGLLPFLIIYAILSCILISIAYLLRALKTRWKNKPFIIQFLLGG